MKTIEELAPTYAEAYKAAGASVNRLQRTVMASVLAMFPHRDKLAVQADFLRDELGADAIQVNVILPGKQLTIVSCPDKATVVKEIPLDDSLCVLSVGADMALSINDVNGSSFLKGHSCQGSWATWASAPIRLNNQPVGTVCALGDEPKQWGEEDEFLIEATCRMIEKTVNDWLKDRKEQKMKEADQ